MKNTRKLVLLAVLAALGSIIGLFESIIPLPFVVPGLRLGLSNIIVLVTLNIFGLKEGIVVSILKSVLLMLMSGNVISFIYSLTGAIFSALGMSFVLKYLDKYLSLVGVSLVGSSLHNFGQVTVATIVLGNRYIYSYLPILLIIGIFTGVFVGISSHFIVYNMENNLMKG